MISTVLRQWPTRLLALAPVLVLVVAAHLGGSAGAEGSVVASSPDAFCAQCGWSDTP